MPRTSNHEGACHLESDLIAFSANVSFETPYNFDSIHLNEGGSAGTKTRSPVPRLSRLTPDHGSLAQRQSHYLLLVLPRVDRFSAIWALKMACHGPSLLCPGATLRTPFLRRFS
jgi:hypothetical protein